MSASILKINGNTVIPLDGVKYISPMNKEDQAKLSENLKIDGTQFHARITLANGTSQLARETLVDLKGKLALVNVGNDRFVPARNIVLAKAFTKDQAEELTGKGYTLGSTFRSTVETSAGIVLSSAHPSQVMERRAKALDRVGQGSAAGQVPNPNSSVA